MTVLEKLLVPEVSRRIVAQGYDGAHRCRLPTRRPHRSHAGRAGQGVGPRRRGRSVRRGARPRRRHSLRHQPAHGSSDPHERARARRRAVADVPDRVPAQRCARLDPDDDADAGQCPLHPDRPRRHGARASRYHGAARGWERAQGYFPPLHLVGPRAKHAGLDLPCSYTADQQAVELVWVGDQQVPDGFEPVRPMVHSRIVPVAECEVFDIALLARWREHRVRILQQAGDEALVVLTPDSAAQAEELGAVEMEPGVYQATVPAAGAHRS